MRPRLQCHPALRHCPERLSDRLLRCTQLVLNHYLSLFIQHAVPAPAIPKIQSHREFLLRKDSGLLACHSDTLRHSRSPYLLRLERVVTGSLSHPAWRPAFSSHLISSNLRSDAGVDVAQLRYLCFLMTYTQCRNFSAKTKVDPQANWSN